MSISQNYLSKVGMQKHQVDLGFFGDNNSDSGSPTDSEERSESLVETASIAALFPANESDTDGSSESNEIPPIFSYCPNSIASFFSPARSSVSENPSIRANEPTSLSISLLFPPTMSETETNDSCSEFDEAVEARFSNSIVSFFPPAKSQTDSVSENDDINPTDPSIPASTRPTRRTIQTSSFRDPFRLLRQFLRQSWVREFSGRERKPISVDSFDPFDIYFKLRALQIATNFFSKLNKLGQGGFGSVYKGLMPNGQEVAVKKHSLESCQGMIEFTNELKLLHKLQHKNLATLYGCCIEGPEKMLIYEYLPNKSLNYFLFDKEKSASLDWPTRFRIVTGIMRGLQYLHEEAPLRVIHRDIKVSNILLDEHLNPKISDFGLAMLFPGDDTHVDRICGTCGYMAPEYAMEGYLSVKTDVFSYGVLVLEIVSGRKNHDTKLSSEKQDLLNYTWMLYQAGRTLELIDPTVAKYNPDEAAMCIQLGLLCCQQSVAERPDINAVHLMLLGDSFTLPRPGKPGIQGRGGRWTSTSTALTNTNASSTLTGATKASGGGSFVEEYSRNSVSVSSIDEGR
nr:G-type lectin S-receptor-like serine/threonine-protein kinase B120 [Quercus suber]